MCSGKATNTLPMGMNQSMPFGGAIATNKGGKITPINPFMSILEIVGKKNYLKNKENKKSNQVKRANAVKQSVDTPFAKAKTNRYRT